MVHPKKGAGVVTGTREIQRDGGIVQYLCIELSDAVNSIVMIPYESLEEIGLRRSILDFKLVKEVLNNEPEELDDHYRTRQSNIQQKIKRGRALYLLQALRDLTWRERHLRLTGADERLRNSIRDRLVAELSLDPSITLKEAQVKLTQIMQRAMKHHDEKMGIVAAAGD